MQPLQWGGMTSSSLLELPAPTPGVAWSIAVLDGAEDSVLAEHESAQPLRTASVGKVFALLEAAHRFESGTLDPRMRVSPAEDERLADSGLWYLLDQIELSLIDVCRLVGAFSDNMATNVLVRELGLESIRAASEGWGFHSSALLDRVRDDRGPQHPPTLSVGSAVELAGFMTRLGRGAVAGPGADGRVLEWLAANADLSMVASAFGLDPLAHGEVDRGISLVNKTGTLSSVRADIGLVQGPGGGIGYAVIADWQPGVGDVRDQVLATMAGIGRRIREHLGA